jgi:hypothetical protein
MACGYPVQPGAYRDIQQVLVSEYHVGESVTAALARGRPGRASGKMAMKSRVDPVLPWFCGLFLCSPGSLAFSGTAKVAPPSQAVGGILGEYALQANDHEYERAR